MVVPLVDEFEFEFEFEFFLADAAFGCYRTAGWCRRCCGGRAVLSVAWLRNMPLLRHFGLCSAVPGFHTIGTDAKEGAAVARLLRVVAVAAAAPNADFRKMALLGVARLLLTVFTYG